MTSTKYIVGESFVGITKDKVDHPHGDGYECKGPYTTHHDGNKWIGTYNPEGYTYYVLSHCYFDNTGIDPDHADEAVPVVWGANALIKYTRIKNWGKAILIGSGDEPSDMLSKMTITLDSCILEGNSRRNPYVKGATVIMKNCLIKNWGKTFYLKSHGIRVTENASLYISNCMFIQDKFIQTTWKNFFKDCIYQITSINNISEMFFPGVCRGIYTETGGIIASLNHCYKNKWWISLGENDPAPMDEKEAYERIEELESKVPNSSEEALHYKQMYESDL